jgi:hypothetical protein
MKKLYILLVGVASLAMIPTSKTEAQIPVLEIISAGITRVIKAVDLEVQRLQNNTIWLQNAQKVIENSMSELHLGEITGWVQKQKDLYGEYYTELWQIKSIITYYHRIKDISTKQAQLISEYNWAWKMLRQDKHFNSAEINYMSQVYSGILNATVQNINLLLLVVNSFTTQMSDAKRLDIVNQVANEVDGNYADLQQFNTQNALLSLQRSKDESDASMVRWMYGLP